MTELKTFQLEQEFEGTNDLYRYLIKNIKFIGEYIGVQIGDIKGGPFCITGKERVTERNILFFASKSEFLESLGELIVLGSAFDVDIVVFFISNANRFHLGTLEWLQKICNDDSLFIVGEVEF